MIEDFEVTNAYGAEGERIVREYGRLMARGEAACEVKRKSRTDLTFYVETEQTSQHGTGPVVAGGIAATQAELFAYVLADTGVVIVFPTALLRKAAPIGTPAAQPRLHKGNPTKGVLLQLERLLDRYEPDRSGWPVPLGGWKETEEIV